ncbi:MAG: hypothetical protein ACMUHY_02885, partial [Thermoplasmatota archaeon]
MGTSKKGMNFLGDIATGSFISNLKLFNKGESGKVGLPPGSLIFTGEKRTEKVTLDIMEFDDKSLTEMEVKDVVQAIRGTSREKVTWININGLHDVELLGKIGDSIGIHLQLVHREGTVNPAAAVDVGHDVQLRRDRNAQSQQRFRR